MGEQAKSVLELMNELRLFYKDLSLLLKTVNDLMEENKWQVPKEVGNVVIADTSRDIKTYTKWYPNVLYHYYITPAYPHLLAFCSVLIGNDRDKEYELNDVLITAGYFEFEKGKKVEKFTFWWPCFYGYMVWNKKIKSRKETINGLDILSSNTEDWKNDITWGKECLFNSVTVFARPLFEIKNSAEVGAKIVTPLLDIILKRVK